MSNIGVGCQGENVDLLRGIGLSGPGEVCAVDPNMVYQAVSKIEASSHRWASFVAAAG